MSQGTSCANGIQLDTDNEKAILGASGLKRAQFYFLWQRCYLRNQMEDLNAKIQVHKNVSICFETRSFLFFSILYVGSYLQEYFSQKSCCFNHDWVGQSSKVLMFSKSIIIYECLATCLQCISTYQLLCFFSPYFSSLYYSHGNLTRLKITVALN